MSADNWAICPKCKRDAKERTAQIKQAVKDAYGKLPADEYLKLVKQLEVEPKLDDNFREDYEIGMQDNGEFYIRYSGECGDCGFSFSYRHTVNALQEPHTK